MIFPLYYLINQLIEDDASVRNIGVENLRSFVYTVYECTNGVDALNFLNTENPQIDLLITDITMPEMNGKELAERVKKIIPGNH